MEKNEALDNIRNSFKFDQIFNMSDVVEAVLTNNVEGLEEMRLFLASQKNKKADIEKLIIESNDETVKAIVGSFKRDVY